MELDLGEKETVQDYVTVPAGTYVCKIEEVRVGSTRAGDPRWSFRLLVEQGEYQGRQAAWDSLVFSERGTHRARVVLEALGLPHTGTVQLEPEHLQGRSALVEIAPADYANLRGETIRRNEVPYNGYRSLDADPPEVRSRPSTPRSDQQSGDATELPF